jgi:hypothetical protein
MNNAAAWITLVREVAGVVRVMPLWKLQTIGQERLDFLYANTGTGQTITLRPGVAYCFRKFPPLIADLVRGAWVRYVRQQNLKIVGEPRLSPQNRPSVITSKPANGTIPRTR